MAVRGGIRTLDAATNAHTPLTGAPSASRPPHRFIPW